MSTEPIDVVDLDGLLTDDAEVVCDGLVLIGVVDTGADVELTWRNPYSGREHAEWHPRSGYVVAEVTR